MISSSPSHGSDGVATDRFENAEVGRIDSVETDLGTWSTVTGDAFIDGRHSKTGDRCMRLTGGPKSSVVLAIAEGVDTRGELSFWAERWTRREPFSFRIETETGDRWRPIYSGDDEILVGRGFLSHVRVPLADEAIKRLRFTVTSPVDTGVLIDDVRIAPIRPQKIVSVDVVPFSLPALVGAKACPLLKLRIETVGQLDPISLTELQVTLQGTTEPTDVSSLQVVRGGTDRGLASGRPIASRDGKTLEPESIGFELTRESGLLGEGTNHFWLACRIDDHADIDRRIGAACTRVLFSDGDSIEPNGMASIQRMGVAVRQGGDDGVHTYRIPGLATTNKGTLIGVYDIRHRGSGDLPGDIDVGMSRSTDGGKSWETMKVIMDMGNDPQWRHDGIGDPAVLVDRDTGTIWVAATWSHGNRSWRGSGPGLKPAQTGQLMLVRSDDDGSTWSKPINITAEVKKPEWCFLLQGPGKGITMADGTIVFAAQYQDSPELNRLPHSTILYSKDHGKSWQVGSGAFDDTTEAQVVEVEPGVLMLNSRYNRKPARVVMTTDDLGKTWNKHPTSEASLIEPGACMASLIDVDRETGKPSGNWLLFSNPDSLAGRQRLTIKASADRGLTWPEDNRLLLDQGKSAGYSCMTMVDAETVGILYEGSQAQMTFQRIKLNELVGKADPAAP